jgi:hypothetical protein
VREISIAFYSPYAKQRIIARLAKDIAAMIRPLLKTDEMQPDEMHLVEI